MEMAWQSVHNSSGGGTLPIAYVASTRCTTLNKCPKGNPATCRMEWNEAFILSTPDRVSYLRAASLTARPVPTDKYSMRGQLIARLVECIVMLPHAKNYLNSVSRRYLANPSKSGNNVASFTPAKRRKPIASEVASLGIRIFFVHCG